MANPVVWRTMIGQQIKEPVSDLPVIDFQPITFSDYPILSEEEVNYYYFDLQAFVLTLLSLSIAYLIKLFISYVCFLQVIGLSWDQKYLHRMWIATIVGKVDDNLAAIECGPPCVSRRNTLWSRVLKVYVATAQPSNQLQRIPYMVVKFSVPM